MISRFAHIHNLMRQVTLGHTKLPTRFQLEDTTGESSGIMVGCITVRVVSLRPCSRTGVLDEQYGRPWLIQGQDSDDAILNTLLLAVLTFEEHEIREGFKFNGKALYEPKH